MRENVNINSLSEQITIVRKAAGKKSGNFYFDLGPSSQSTWGGFSMKKTTNKKVDVVTLDEYLSNIINIDVLKIDVEGAELLAMKGGESLLRKFKPLVLSEYHPEQLEKVSGCTGKDYIEFMSSVGYTATTLDGTKFDPSINVEHPINLIFS